MSAADLAIPLLNALRAYAPVTSKLAAFQGSYPIFTRRPAPTAAPYPMIMISPDIAVSDQDGIDDFRPIQERDITVYGQNSTAQKYRDVETMAYAIRVLFHSQWRSITVPSWKVIDISARGPLPAPTDDDQTIARLVALTIQLAAV